MTESTGDDSGGKRHGAGWVAPAEVFQPLLIESVVMGIGSLPTLPAVAAYLLNHVDEDVHVPQIIQMLSYDQVMTARILRFANSAYIGSAAPVKTVVEAIRLIGQNALRDTICISAVSGLMVADRCPKFDLDVFWRHSIAAACCASSLAQHAGAAVSPSQAFTAGLLHDIGRMVLACTFPVEYSGTLRYQSQTGCTLLRAEQASIGIDHVQTGLELAKHWKLDGDLQAALSVHHSDASLTLTASSPLSAFVYLANLIAHAVVLSDPDDVSETDQIAEGLHAIGLAASAYPEVLAGARAEYRQAVEALSL